MSPTPMGTTIAGRNMRARIDAYMVKFEAEMRQKENSIYLRARGELAAKIYRLEEDEIIPFMKRVVPVSSGALLDNMISGFILFVQMYPHKYGQPPGWEVGVYIPVLETRPIIINNPTHAGVIGYGKPYIPLNVIPNANPISLSRTGKSMKYLLNDPLAKSDYVNAIKGFIREKMIEFEAEVEANYEKYFTLEIKPQFDNDPIVKLRRTLK